MKRLTRGELRGMLLLGVVLALLLAVLVLYRCCVAPSASQLSAIDDIPAGVVETIDSTAAAGVAVSDSTKPPVADRSSRKAGATKTLKKKAQPANRPSPLDDVK
jgi:hypothetical protein